MTISSRTPEGDSCRCPICGHRSRVEPSIETRDASCPRCGHLLWVGNDVTIEVLDHSDKWLAKELVVKMATDRFGLPGELVRESLNRLDLFKQDEIDFGAMLEANSWAKLVAIINRKS